MSTHAEHHYVPAFLLREWESGADQKLSAFRWIRGNLHEKRYKAKSVAKQRNLYAIQNGNQSIERDFLAKHVDDPAALVHQLIVSKGLTALTIAHRYTWTRLLTSVGLRGPGSIEMMRVAGAGALDEQLDADPGGLLEERGPEPEESLRHFVEKHDPGLFKDFGLMSFPFVLQDSMFNKMFFEAQWATRRLPQPSQSLLIVDRPLTLHGAMADQFLIYLPLTPNLAFLAFNNDEIGTSFQAVSDSMFVKNMNKSTVKQASQYVFGVNGHHQPLVERHLEKTSAGPGFSFGPRPPMQE